MLEMFSMVFLSDSKGAEVCKFADLVVSFLTCGAMFKRSSVSMHVIATVICPNFHFSAGLRTPP